jgi:DNA (cytosine-5)-methyltransferase 1
MARIGSLFSGYGGLDIAAAQLFGATVAWHVEYDTAPSKILAHHWPDVPNYGDITTVDWSAVEPIDILTGGSPCQDLSAAYLGIEHTGRYLIDGHIRRLADTINREVR